VLSPFSNTLVLVVVGAVVTIGLVAVVLTRLWVKQISLRLDESLEFDQKLVPLRSALTALRDATAQAHSIARELQTLQQLREEASTVITELRGLREDFAQTYNNMLDDLTTHGETLVEMSCQLKEAHDKLDEAYLKNLIVRVVFNTEQGRSGEGLIAFLEANGYRINARLRALIVEFYNRDPGSSVRETTRLREEPVNEGL